MRSKATRDLTEKFQDYDIIKEIGGIEDISFLFLARHIPSNRLVSLKLTDLTISTDYEFIEELVVIHSN